MNSSPYPSGAPPPLPPPPGVPIMARAGLPPGPPRIAPGPPRIAPIPGPPRISPSFHGGPPRISPSFHGGPPRISPSFHGGPPRISPSMHGAPLRGPPFIGPPGLPRPRPVSSAHSVIGSQSFHSVRGIPSLAALRPSVSVSAVRPSVSVVTGRSRRYSDLSSEDEGVGDYLSYSKTRVFWSILIGSAIGGALGYGLYVLVTSYQREFGNFLTQTNFSDPGISAVPSGKEVSHEQNSDFSPLMGPISDSGRVGVNDENCGRIYHSLYRRSEIKSEESAVANESVRIVGGHNAKIIDHPWQVSLWVNGNHICGGSIIASNWVLFTAHCTIPYPNARDWIVNAGEADQRLMVTRGQPAQVTHIVKHQDFDEDTYENDIALMRLNRHLIFGANVNTICLPTSTQELIPGAVCQVSGWGVTAEDGFLSNILQAVQVKVIDSQQCNSEDWLSGLVTKNMFCAGEPSGGKDACQGDSGGPLACGSKERSLLIGVVSWGIGCGEPKAPGVYTHLARYYPWIRQEISEYEGRLAESTE